MDKLCLNHKCTKGPSGSRATFTPARRTQYFCCAECRLSYAAWRQMRGYVAIPPLIAGDWQTLRELRAELIKETNQ